MSEPSGVSEEFSLGAVGHAVMLHETNSIHFRYFSIPLHYVTIIAPPLHHKVQGYSSDVWWDGEGMEGVL